MLSEFATFATLTPEQLARYFVLTELPVEYYPAKQPMLDAAFLAVLHKHHITTFPYDNLALHYSKKGARVSLETDDICQKLLAGRGRGGYCMENNLLFNLVLRSLGFSVYITGARVRFRQGGVPVGDYSGWVHALNIVTLPDGSRWAVDTAFGGDGMTTPLPLTPDLVTRNLGSQEIRLTRGSIPHLSAPVPDQFWIYQYRNSPTIPWNAYYAFNETEFLTNDLKVLNWYTSTYPETILAYTVILTRFLRGEGGEVAGKVMLVNGDVKRNMAGRTELVQSCKTEKERVKALKEFFCIDLLEEERLGISGRVTELKGESRRSHVM